MENGQLAFTGGRVVTPFEVIDPGTVVVSGPRIIAVGPAEATKVDPGMRTIDVAGSMVIPGFVEVHIHGYGGVMMGSLESSPDSSTGTIKGDVLAVADMLPATGITSFLPTLLAAHTLDGILEILQETSVAKAEQAHGAQILGIHMEGPFFSTQPKGPYDVWPPGGSIPAELARKPSLEELMEMVRASNGDLRMVSLSPEVDGALDLIVAMCERGIVPSGAHSFATFEETLRAVEAGMTTVTHLYNGMRHQDHRDPGIIEASLVCDAITGQIIADGVHVHPPALEMALRCKGHGNLAVTTDNTGYAGMPNGHYRDIIGRPLIKTDEYVRIVDSTLFGSVMPMNRQVAVLVSQLGVPIQDAIGMATVVPSQIIGVHDAKGSLEPGKDADIVILNRQLEVEKAYCRGRETHRAGGACKTSA